MPNLVQVDFHREELGVSSHDFLALPMEEAESCHQPLQLVDNVLDMFGVKQLQLGQNVRPQPGKLLLGMGPGSREGFFCKPQDFGIKSISKTQSSDAVSNSAAINSNFK